MMKKGQILLLIVALLYLVNSSAIGLLNVRPILVTVIQPGSLSMDI
jgi:hypothetical protein